MTNAPRHDHQQLAERNRRLSIAIADHVRADRGHIPRALLRVQQRLATGAGPARAVLHEWEHLLQAAMVSDEGVEHLLAVLTQRSDHTTRLRSSSPFAGVLSRDERRRILGHVDQLERLHRTVLRRATWTGAHSTLKQQGTESEPPTPNVERADAPDAFVRAALRGQPEFITVAAAETGLLEATIRAWVRDGVDHLTSGAALMVTRWSYELAGRPFPPPMPIPEIPLDRP